MSSFRARLPKHTDQENEFKHAPKDENATLPTKRPLSAHSALDKRVRVPLGGKDQNQAFQLQRSKLFIPQNATVLRPRQALPKQPTLSKSNSSLGFTHQPSKIAPAANQFRNANPLKNERFPLEDAHRPRDLVPRFSTDSLKKQQPKLQPLPVTLEQTLTHNTRQLHASNIVPSTQNRADPLKKGYQALEQEGLDAIIEKLADDKDSVEIVPHRLPPMHDIPVGSSALEKEDLDFLRTGVRQIPKRTFDEDLDISFDSTLEHEEDVEANRKLEAELASAVAPTGGVGLTAQELDDLLDF